MGKIIDLTGKVEVVNNIAEGVGINISGLYCSVGIRNRFFDEFYVECNGEISADNLIDDVSIHCIAFDEKGRVLGESSSYYSKNDFSGYNVFCMRFNTNLKPIKFKLIFLKN